MNRTIVHSLCFNTPDEVHAMMQRVRTQNKGGYEQYLVDLGFPLETGDVIPENIPEAEDRNSKRILELASSTGSYYLKFINRGVSPNWSNFIKQIQPDDTDCVIGADCDEYTQDDGWIDAMSRVLRSDQKIALVALMMTDMEAGFKERFGKQITEQEIDGVKCYIVDGLLSWCLIGISGEFLKKINYEIPFPPKASLYGWIESVLYPLIKQHGYRWAILPEYRNLHTNNSTLYRQWKDRIVYKVKEGQPGFQEWLIAKRAGIVI